VVRPDATDDAIITGAAIDIVIPGTTDQAIIATDAAQGIAPCATFQQVIAAAAIQDITTGCSITYDIGVGIIGYVIANGHPVRVAIPKAQGKKIGCRPVICRFGGLTFGGIRFGIILIRSGIDCGIRNHTRNNQTDKAKQSKHG
jgi:hypothetical protein